MTPRVSIIVPTFNRVDLLGQALDSIFSQTMRDFETIVVDDGSTDGTREWIGRYPHPIVYLEQANAGPSAARNRGMKAARGAFFAFLDSDDTFLPRHLEARLAVFERNPRAGVVYGGSEVVEADGTLVKVQHPYPEHRGRVLRALLSYDFVTISAVMRRDCYDRVGPMNESLRFAEDWLYWLQIAAHYEFDYSDEVTLRIRRSPDSASRRPLADLAAENHTMFDLAFTDRTLKPLIAPYRGVTYARMYLDYAKTALQLLRLREARRFLLLALRNQPLSWEVYPLLLKTFLPGSVLQAARRITRRNE